jgi:hypothetical protein
MSTEASAMPQQKYGETDADFARRLQPWLDESPDNAAIAAVREAVIREDLRWHGLPADGPIPLSGASKVYVTHVERYVRIGIAALRRFEAERERRGGGR